MPLAHDELAVNPEMLVIYNGSLATDPITPYDGLVGAMLGENAFITSPNCTQIFEPPLGERSLLLRSDGSYGIDDYFQWPQVFIDAYSHLSCVMRKPRDVTNPLRVLWWRPGEADFVVDAESGVNGMGSISPSKAQELRSHVEALLTRFNEVKEDPRLYAENGRNRRLVESLVTQLVTWLHRIEHLSLPFPTIVFSVAELQRRWLELEAYMTYMLIMKPRMVSTSTSILIPDCRAVLGAFTYDFARVEFLAQMGIPVWLIRPTKAFSSKTRIKELAPLIRASPHLVYTPFPSKQIIITCSATALDRFASLQKTAWDFFASANDPAASWGIEEPVAKRLKLDSPSGNQSRRPDVNAEKFKQSDHPAMPRMVPVWAHALARANISHNAIRQPFPRGHNGYAFPDPNLFIPKDGASTNQANKIATYFTVWLHFRQAITLHAEHGRFSPETLKSPSQWRDALIQTFIQRGPRTDEPSSSSHSAQRMTLMRDLLFKWSRNAGLSSTSTPTAPLWNGLPLPASILADTDVAQQIIYEICELNFRWELRFLDFLKSRPLGKVTLAEWNERRRRHHHIYLSCFPSELEGASGGDVTTVTYRLATRGLAAPTIEERRPYIFNFVNLMQDWSGVPVSLSSIDSTTYDTLTSAQVAKLEEDSIRFYIQSFVFLFARAPIVPHFLILESANTTQSTAAPR